MLLFSILKISIFHIKTVLMLKLQKNPKVKSTGKTILTSTYTYLTGPQSWVPKELPVSVCLSHTHTYRVGGGGHASPGTSTKIVLETSVQPSTVQPRH